VIFTAAAVVLEIPADTFAANSDLYRELAFWRNPTLLFAAPVLAASLLYYLRFRLPFALALVALFAFLSVSNGVEATTGIVTPLIPFAVGIVVLAAALAYDARDPKRVTRLSDCAFWLHLVATPLIVSPVIILIKHSTNGSGLTSLVVLLTVLVLGFVALAIERRALLVSSLTYFTIAVTC
jgi:hypothetical protein